MSLKSIESECVFCFESESPQQHPLWWLYQCSFFCTGFYISYIGKFKTFRRRIFYCLHFLSHAVKCTCFLENIVWEHGSYTFFALLYLSFLFSVGGGDVLIFLCNILDAEKCLLKKIKVLHSKWLEIHLPGDQVTCSVFGIDTVP